MQLKTKSKVTLFFLPFFFTARWCYSRCCLQQDEVQNCLLLVFCLFWFVLIRIQNIFAFKILKISKYQKTNIVMLALAW